MRAFIPLIALSSSLALSGCVAKTALDAVTAPVKVVSKTVDVATTSQSEADEKRGRELRKQEEALGKLERRYEKQLKRCREGDRRECDRARLTYSEIGEMKATMPAPPPKD